MKSSVTSNSLRADGNEFYKQKNFFDALLKYNESLCYSEDGSESAGHAYANRSAIYLEMKLFDECLRNIKAAFSHKYPEKNHEVLKKREEKCRQMMKNLNKKSSREEEVLEFFKLSHEPNDKIKSIAGCLELKCNKKYGRHIVTNRGLSVGDIVAIDEPAFSVIKADSRYDTCHDNNVYQRCGNCLMENNFDLIPCDKCTKVMFCSENCKEYAMKNHHKYECEIIDDLLKSGIKHIILRLIFEAVSYFDGDINALENFIKENEKKNFTIFNIQSSGVQRRKEIFLAVLSLAAEVDDSNSIEDFFKFLPNSWRAHENFIKNLLKKLSSVGSKDVHGIGTWSLKNQESALIPSQSQQLIGNACYLFSSFLNHSCAPNVRRLNVSNKIVLFCLRPIKAGDQLFDSYRQNFNVQPKKIRQENLLKDYGFMCDCEACVNDYPLNKDLKTFDESILEYVWDSYDELQHLTQLEAKIRLKEYFEVFTKFHKNFPSSELVVLQECISNCLIAITKPRILF